MRSLVRFNSILASIILVALSDLPLQAATPRDELLQYVPEQVGFCVVVNDLRSHSAELVDSPFVEHLLKTPLGKDLTRANEVVQMLKLEKDLKNLLGMDVQQLGNEIFGDAVVLVYSPGPPDKPEQEQGMILVHARDAKLLARMIEQINTKQKEAGDLKATEEKQYKNVKYVQRTEKEDTNFYYLDGSILLFTGQEELLRQALDQGRAANKEAEPALARRFRELGAAQSFLSLWINPRTFDATLQADLTNPKKTAAELAFAKGFKPYWKALDGVVFSVALEKELKVRIGLKVRREVLPPPARRFFGEAMKPSRLWRAFPDEPLFAFAARLDLPALFEMLGEFMPEASRKSARLDLNRNVAALLGKEDFFKEVLTHIGPEIGLCVSAPPTERATWFPDCLLAIHIGGGSEKPAFGQSLLTALHAYAFAFILGHNRGHPQQQMSLKTEQQGQREVKYLVNEGGFPPGFKPATTLQQGYFLLASSPEVAFRGAESLTPGGDEKTSGQVPLLRVSFKELRRWLQERQEALTPLVAEQNQLTKEVVRQRLTHLLSALELLDRLEISTPRGAGSGCTDFNVANGLAAASVIAEDLRVGQDSNPASQSRRSVT